MELSTIRLYGSIAIILGCCVFLYPKLLHPIVMTIFGFGGSDSKQQNKDFSQQPMRDRPPHMGQPGGGDIPDHVRRSMRQGPHPGMRAAAAEQSKQTKGSGRGMMGVVLPMYAVGIVIYLIYTLCKVFNKKNQSSPTRHGERTSQERVGQSAQDSSQDEAELDMRKLQEKLAETEEQMSKILAAMQSVQNKVGVQETSMDRAEGVPGVNTELAGSKPGETPGDGSGNSSATSSESYEIINQPDADNTGGSGEDVGKVETLSSKARTDGNQEVEHEDGEGISHVSGDNDHDDEVEDVMIDSGKDKQEEEEDNVTVRKRITKKDDADS